MSVALWPSLRCSRPHPRRPRGSQSGREKRQDGSCQVRAKKPLGTDPHRTISKNSSGCRLLIGHKKCFVLLCPIGEQFLLSSFREFVQNGYCLDHGLSRSCTKEMYAVSKLLVCYKIPIWFQNIVCPETKDAFPLLRGRPILLITGMITDPIGLHSVLLPLVIIIVACPVFLGWLLLAF